MSIIVTTSGPLGNSADNTWSALASAIADDIDDTTGEYGSAIDRAISSAIRYCERETYYFNETRDVTFATVAGRDFYDASDNTNIKSLVRIEQAWVERGNGERTLLNRVDPREIEDLSDNSASRGKPYQYSYFGQRLRLYPIPDNTVYTIRLQLAPFRLQTAMDDSQQDGWIPEAYDMVKARAKYILAKDTLKYPEMAVEALNDYNDQADALKRETSMRNGTGQIRPTSF